MPVPTAPSQATGLLLPITWGRDWNFFQKLSVSNTGYNPYADMIITFTTQGVQMLNLGSGSTAVVEYSFNGVTTHGEMNPQNPSAGMTWDNRVVSKIWFRVQTGSTGPIVVSVQAWATH